MKRALMLALGVAALVAVAVPAAADTQATASEGRDLFEVHCATCHGENGQGDVAPPLVGVGAAMADFQLRTGRMPMADVHDQAVRKPSPFSDEQIKALVAFVASLGEGPPIPTVDVAAGSVSRGGSIFRTNCSGCHGAAGRGEALSYGRIAPDLYQATPLVVAEAVRTGPSQMPVFEQFTSQDVDDLAAYVVSLQRDPNPGGWGLGRLGPVPEGLVAWVVGLGLLVLVARAIERKTT
jgi:ubiquinol-cytochrome c reductase cytochrome c subunit